VTLRFGSRVFEPRAFTTLLALALVASLVVLGRWQLHRADEKQALYTLFDSGQDATRAVDAATPRLPRYQHMEAVGSYDSARQILIDNMSSTEGRAGYYVITPFALQGGGWILVNRGWVPVGTSRAAKPDVAVSTQEREIKGRADELPRAGMQLGARLPLALPYPVVANFPTHTEIAALLRESAWAHAANLVLLDPSEPDGYLRQWQPPGFPPIRHIAYAVQWFSLAAALIVIYIVTNLRRAERKRA
jgi:surfeit locus 1 family protein